MVAAAVGSWERTPEARARGRRVRRGLAAWLGGLALLGPPLPAAEAALPSGAYSGHGAPSAPPAAPVAPTRAPLATTATRVWGGQYDTGTGETVAFRFSDSYPPDPALAQRWAGFFGSLVHGSELARLTVHFAPLQEVRQICGRLALACYSSAQELIVSVADAVAGDRSTEAVLAHEYGHHIARNRSNPPWRALDYGTKRWASYIRVCSRAANRTLFPGDSGFRYQLDPAEGFAEAYRLLNERRRGLPESPWNVVDQSLYPDDEALRLLEQDVLSPWDAETATTLRGSFRRGGARTRSFTIATPVDGTFRARLVAKNRGAYTLTLRDGGGALRGAGLRTDQTTICGQRSIVVRVGKRAGPGTFTVEVSRP